MHPAAARYLLCIVFETIPRSTAVSASFGYGNILDEKCSAAFSHSSALGRRVSQVRRKTHRSIIMFDIPFDSAEGKVAQGS